MLFINRKGSLNYLFSITKLKLSVELSVKLIESDDLNQERELAHTLQFNNQAIL
jgi:hypothetical protein